VLEPPHELIDLLNWRNLDLSLPVLKNLKRLEYINKQVRKITPKSQQYLFALVSNMLLECPDITLSGIMEEMNNPKWINRLFSA
jgi:hypothetical protein